MEPKKVGPVDEKFKALQALKRTTTRRLISHSNSINTDKVGILEFPSFREIFLARLDSDGNVIRPSSHHQLCTLDIPIVTHGL